MKLSFNMLSQLGVKLKNIEEEYRLDSLQQWFYEKHGEKEYNKLMIKVNDNFYSKMNK